MTKRVVRLTAYEKKRLAKAADYVRDHLHQPLLPQSVALAVDLSLYKLKAGFVQVYRQPFSDYLKAERMQKAALLLRESNALVATIARQCGYRNESSFHRAFKQWHGETPDRYRRD